MKLHRKTLVITFTRERNKIKMDWGEELGFLLEMNYRDNEAGRRQDLTPFVLQLKKVNITILHRNTRSYFQALRRLTSHVWLI